MSRFHSSDLKSRPVDVAGEHLRLTSYRVGNRFSCRIETPDGGNIARATGSSREEAEQSALEHATLTLQLRDARSALSRATEAIGSPTPATGVRRKEEQSHTRPRWRRGPTSTEDEGGGQESSG